MENEYAKEVSIFTKLPRKTIKERKDMLISLGIVNTNGVLKIRSNEELNQLTGNLITSRDKLWKASS